MPVDLTDEATAPSYRELRSRSAGEQFAILYDAQFNNSAGHLLWRKEDPFERFDFFGPSPRTGELRGDIQLSESGEPAGGCRWSFLTGEDVEVRCAMTSLIVPFDQLFNAGFPILEAGLSYSGQATVMGTAVTCFQSTPERTTGNGHLEICLSDEGLPLYISMNWSLAGGVVMAATSTLDETVLPDIQRLPWDGTTQGAPPEVANRIDVQFPPIPSLRQFLTDKEEPSFEDPSLEQRSG